MEEEATVGTSYCSSASSSLSSALCPPQPPQPQKRDVKTFRQNDRCVCACYCSCSQRQSRRCARPTLAVVCFLSQVLVALLLLMVTALDGAQSRSIGRWSALSSTLLMGKARVRRFAPLNKSQHFLIKFALKECKVPDPCWKTVEKSLLEGRRVPECDPMDFYKVLFCLDQVIMMRTNITDLNSKTGGVCCETIPEVSVACRAACRSALYAPTLSASNKLNRIHTICDKSDAEADSSVLTCIATTSEWLPEKFKIR